MGSGRATVRDALSDALMRPGGVVMLLVLGQDPAQMPLAENQDPVQELPAQRANEALAGSVHPGRLDGRAQDRGGGGLKNGVEKSSEVRSAVANQEPEVAEPAAEA